VAVGGSTVVDCIHVGRPKSEHRPSFVFEAVLLILLMIVISLIVALALLDNALPNAVYYVVAFVSLANLGLAYRVEMDLALIDAGYL
jgi:Na+/H+ antiporter NhaC